MAYKDLVSNYERTRRLNSTQHVELVTILQKRLARGSRIQADYFELSGPTLCHLARGSPP